MKPAEIAELKQKAIAEVQSAGTANEVEAVRIKYLGRKGLLPVIMRGLKDIDPSERAEAGRLANELKKELIAVIEAKKAVGAPDQGTIVSEIDYSLPGRWRKAGSRHPLSYIVEETCGIFRSMGFTVAEGPDIETAYNNFEALNTPGHHPSLDQQDTFWLDSGELLRTQTSPVQIRVMKNQRPPVRIITPGRCYRRDTTDATHSANFHQIEGLYVDDDVSLADLKGDLAYFARKLMGSNVKIRFRPHFFPFTEPSVECDFSCHVCGGRGCAVCKHSGWIEIAGAGIVDTRVFDMVEYDSEAVTGYAFGMGVERIAMVKYGIKDIRHLYDNDLRFLEQFK